MSHLIFSKKSKINIFFFKTAISLPINLGYYESTAYDLSFDMQHDGFLIIHIGKTVGTLSQGRTDLPVRVRNLLSVPWTKDHFGEVQTNFFTFSLSRSFLKIVFGII